MDVAHDGRDLDLQAEEQKETEFFRQIELNSHQMLCTDFKVDVCLLGDAGGGDPESQQHKSRRI